MKKMMTRALFLLLAGAVLTSCNDRYDRDGEVVDMDTGHIFVDDDGWVWNGDFDRLEYVYDWDGIDRYMYENGVITAGVFVEEGGYEFLRSLPYVQTYVDGGQTFTRTISYDVVPGSVAFYIQDSDLAYLEGATQDYTFKVTLFWREHIDR